MLTMIQNPYALDGRVTTHPPSARGFSASNCYLVSSAGHGVLLDTGLTVHERPILDALHDAGADALQLSIFALRLGEYDSICNIRPVIERFSVDRLFGGQLDGLPWVDFRPEWTAPGTPVGSDRLREVEYVHLTSDATIDVDPGGACRLEVMRPTLRLLLTHWVYEAVSETLFTSDSFTYLTRPTADGPWIVGEDDPVPTVAEVAAYLEATRFWWLRSADPRRLLDELDAVVDRWPIGRIAPAYGCVIEGREVVAAHFGLLREAISCLGRSTMEVSA